MWDISDAMVDCTEVLDLRNQMDPGVVVEYSLRKLRRSKLVTEPGIFDTSNETNAQAPRQAVRLWMSCIHPSDVQQM